MTADEEPLSHMETWQELHNEENDQAGEQEKALWHALEEGKHAPAAEQLWVLSGLLEGNIARVGKAWRGLSLEVRHELIRSLRRTASRLPHRDGGPRRRDPGDLDCRTWRDR